MEQQDYFYQNWHISDSTFEQSNFKICQFFQNFMVKNLPCLIKNVASNWQCSKKWVTNNNINYNYITDNYGNLDAPVADCGTTEYNSHSKTTMKVSEYMAYLQESNKEQLLYLKDWHLKKLRPNDTFYEVPLYFLMDWLNEYAVDNQEDDYMFVYIGPLGSWTPLHEDVYCSYSWSVNVVGRKKWIFLPPGEENKLKDKCGKLPLLFDDKLHHNVKYHEIIQEAGDALFVPSGWHHQVLNEIDTISINHNWMNACNVKFVWKALVNALESVEKEIAEFKDTPEFPAQCQLILKSVFGMDFTNFMTLLIYIAKKRLAQLHADNLDNVISNSLGLNVLVLDLRNILMVMDSICVHPMFLSENFSLQADVLNLKLEMEAHVC